ncbi:MAG: hypothetical protein R3194_13325, partial [Limnobacter sp.]|nr:hypothetical protein [Limnobacter sp.]
PRPAWAAHGVPNQARGGRPGGQQKTTQNSETPGKLPQPSEVLRCGFTKKEADYLHQAIKAAQMMWFEGDGLVLAKKDAIELHFKPGQSEFNRWVVLAFPVIDMNVDGAVDVALHFLTESYVMAHALELQFQAAINLETEKLEFLIQLPLEGLSSIELGNMIAQFVEALAQGVKEELSRLMDELSQS